MRSVWQVLITIVIGSVGAALAGLFVFCVSEAMGDTSSWGAVGPALGFVSISVEAVCAGVLALITTGRSGLFWKTLVASPAVYWILAALLWKPAVVTGSPGVLGGLLFSILIAWAAAAFGFTIAWVIKTALTRKKELLKGGGFPVN